MKTVLYIVSSRYEFDAVSYQYAATSTSANFKTEIVGGHSGISGTAEPGAPSAPADAEGVLGEGAGRGSPLPAKGVRGYNPRKIF